MSITAAAFPCKQGQTLQIGMVLQSDDGTPVDISAATIGCEFQDALGANQVAATITLASATGASILSLTSEQTAALPLGMMFGDVLYALPGGAFFSQTFTLLVSPAITGGGG
jgi:hypothetical protein